MSLSQIPQPKFGGLALVAWALVAANGTVIKQSGFSSIVQTGTVGNSLATLAAALPTPNAFMEIASANNLSAAAVPTAMITATNQINIYTGNGSASFQPYCIAIYC
jgi:hypothetical protein